MFLFSAPKLREKNFRNASADDGKVYWSRHTDRLFLHDIIASQPNTHVPMNPPNSPVNLAPSND